MCIGKLNWDNRITSQHKSNIHEESLDLKAGLSATERAALDWMINHQALRHYCDKQGTCEMPKTEFYECLLPHIRASGDFRYKGNLGVWLNAQRINKRNGKLKPERELLLQEMVMLILLRS